VHSLHNEAETGETPQERVLRAFRENPALFSDLQAQRTSQVKVARDLEVSQSAVSRAYQKALNNGHGGGEDEA